MYHHPPVSVLFVDDGSTESIRTLWAYLKGIDHLRLDHLPRLPGDLFKWDVVVTAVEAVSGPDLDRLAACVQAGKGWLNVIGRDAGQTPAGVSLATLL